MLTREQIKAKILSDQQWLERAIVAIYNRQTADEQVVKDTKHENGHGFNSADARTGTYYAEWVLSGKHLSGVFLQKAAKMMVKYCGQLEIVAVENAAREALGKVEVGQ